MTDRPPSSPRFVPASGDGARQDPFDDAAPARPDPAVDDAVFEDLDAGRRPLQLQGPSWELIPLDPEPEPDPAPAVQVGDPFADLAYSGGTEPRPDPLFSEPEAAPGLGGFRIDFGDPAPEPSTALAPLSRPVPALPAPSAPPAVPPPPAAPRAEARRSARDKAQMLRRHLPLIVLCVLLGLGLAALCTAFAPTVYEAYSVLLVNANQAQGGFVDAPGQELRVTYNQALILQQNPEIAEGTASQLLGTDDAGSLSVVRGAAEQFGQPVTASKLADYLQEEVVTVAPAAEQVDAFRLGARAETGTEAALVASIYTNEYLRQSRESNRARVSETASILQTRLAESEGQLEGIEARLKNYMTQQNAAGLDEQTRSAVNQIGSLQSQLDVARVQATTYQAQLSQLQSDLASVGTRLSISADQAATTSPAEVQALDAQIAELERLVEQVYLRNPEFRSNPYAHPDLRSMNERLEGMRADRRRMAAGQTDAAVASGGLDMGSQGSNGPAYIADLQRQISQTRANLQGARAQAAALSARLGQARGQLQGVPEQQAVLSQLERRRQATEQTVNQYRAELDKAQLAESTELGLAQLIRDVQVPRKPTSPNLPLNLGLGGLLGLMLGLAGAAVRYRTDARLYAPADLEEIGFTVLGTVPDVKSALRESRHDVEGSLVHPSLVVLTRPFTPEAEAFRHLHANLQAGGAAAQVVLVSGAEAETGKSFVAANLAAAAAQSGRRVLLVDADLRKPSVAALLGLEPQNALGEGPEGSNLVYWSTAVPGLFAMTPHDAAARPEEMWAPHVVGDLLRNLRGAFDLVLIDAPPALIAADAALLAPAADAAVLVADAGRSDADALTQVASELSGVGLHRIGAVLNRFTPRKSVGYRRTAAIRHAAIHRDAS